MRAIGATGLRAETVQGGQAGGGESINGAAAVSAFRRGGPIEGSIGGQQQRAEGFEATRLARSKVMQRAQHTARRDLKKRAAVMGAASGSNAVILAVRS